MHTELISTPPCSRNLSVRRIGSLAELFAVKCAEEKGLALRPLSEDAVALIASYDWKGDLSAMEATIRHAVVMADGDEIDVSVIRLPSRQFLDDKSDNGNDVPHAMRALLGNTVSDIERDLILITLKYCCGNRTRAADILGISVRTLRNKLKRYEVYGTTIDNPGDGDASRRLPEPRRRS